METLFYIVPALMAGGAVCVLVAVARQASRLRRAWRSGLTAQARCLRAYTATSGGGTSGSAGMHHVYEFTTPEGRAVRFAESGGPATVVEGDVVTVRHPAGQPERATAHAPAPGLLAAGQGCVCAFLGVFVAGCLAFMAAVHVVFSASGGLLP
ncbi:DUF3592 domain-containing protein [Streptomyces sp. NRRL S-340]|uniref:DUF3592 domain-containing protein n=1 Tax=Streptomyces sp. NRRL S-340 TaxID=1463901 RepID=UPI000562D0A8|nr:DUF3592 domain-containing protein [Streptomyces sp. NRRL S-340]